jgi:hypothetical protein
MGPFAQRYFYVVQDLREVSGPIVPTERKLVMRQTLRRGGLNGH